MVREYHSTQGKQRYIPAFSETIGIDIFSETGYLLCECKLHEGKCKYVG